MAAQLSNKSPTAMGNPTIDTISNWRVKSSKVSNPASASSSKRCCLNKSWQVYPVIESSGKTMISTPFPSACAIWHSICCRLYSQSATFTVGTAAATLMNPFFMLFNRYLRCPITIFLERGILICIMLEAVNQIIDESTTQHAFALSMYEHDALSFLGSMFFQGTTEYV